MDEAVSIAISDADIWQLPQSLSFLQGSLSMSYTHMIDMRCLQANNENYRFVETGLYGGWEGTGRGPELIVLGPQDICTRLGPWFIMTLMTGQISSAGSMIGAPR